MWHRVFLPFLFISLVGGTALASSTQIWRQDTRSDFEQGKATNISIRSDGYVQLGPKLEKMFESSDAFFWTAAEDGEGRLFVGSGNDGKVYLVENGNSRVYFDAPEMEVHALAVDGQDNLYVGTSPDGKVYRITPDGQGQVFYEPGAKYIWGLAWDGQGYLYVGTGEEGQIFRVNARGQGELFFDSEEKHIRCMVVDGGGNILAGTESRARVYRLTPAGKPFILYEPGVKEITSIVLGPDGTLYAAGIGRTEGTPPAASPSGPSTSAPTVLGVITVTAGGPSAVQEGFKEAGTSASTKPPSPGSVIFQIAKDGHPREIWTSDKTTVYSLVLRPDGSLLAGTGDKGGIYHIQSDGQRSTLVNQVEPAQVTSFVASRRHPIVYAVTSNMARVYALNSELEREGTLISQVKDTDTFSKWGRIIWRNQAPPKTSVSIFTRTGNTQDPDNTWTEWTEAVYTPLGFNIASPPARFIQWKLILRSTDGRQSPLVDSVEVSYLPRNAAPKVESLTLQPPDVAFEPVPTYGFVQSFASGLTPSSGGSSGAAQAQTNRVRRQQQAGGQTPPRQVLKEGFRTLSWQASDINDDDLTYSVLVRGEGETAWKLLKGNIEETFLTWDTREMADGSYTLRLAASDARSNPPDLALTTEQFTEWFEIDNTPPQIQGLTVTVEPGSRLRIQFQAVDTATPISLAEYLIDNIEPRQVLSKDGILDYEQETFDFVVSDIAPGEHTVIVRVRDAADNMMSAKAIVTTKQ